ncbi:MAG: DNA polymerase III subunit delta [Lachnospiraceae bacterium]|nr:DNA polymerase III subunit delta [Lachnospiraceae bacterium]
MAYRKDDFQALNEINSDIQNKSFRHVYLLYGDEDYLVRQFASRLKEAIVGDDEMNYTAVSGSTATIDDILSTAGTLPFFADRRLIVMDECGFFKKSQPQILALVQKCPDYLYLIFTEKSVEASSKLYKVVDKCGLAAKMSTPSEGTLRQWAQKQFREAGKSIEPSAASLLIEMTGSTMGLLKGEIDKLISYCADAPVVRYADVQAVSSTVADSTIFTLIDFIGKRNQKRALSCYREMLMQNVSAAFILNRMEVQFTGILGVMEGKRSGASPDKLAKLLRAAPFQIRKYTEQAANFSEDKVKKLLSSCARMDEKIKTGRMKDNIAVEMLIIEAVEL